MEIYNQFLNDLGMYNRLLSLQKIITTYEHWCGNENEKECLGRLRKSLEGFQLQYQVISNSLSKEALKSKIFANWNFISQILLKEPKLIEERDLEFKLPIYALVQDIVRSEIDFITIYAFFIENNLFDPNCSVGVSNEPFFSMIPQKELNIFSHLNEKVITDKRTDFHILRNGSDVFEYGIFFLKESKTAYEKEYWHKYLLWCLQSNLSVLDSMRYMSAKKKICYEYTPNIYEIFRPENHLDDLAKYLLSEEGIKKQYENSIYPSKERDKAIDFYMKKLTEVGVEASLLRRLK